MASKYPEMKPKFDKYKDMLRNVTEDDYNNKTFQTDINKILLDFVKLVNKLRKNNNLTVAQNHDLMFDFKFEANTNVFIYEHITSAISIQVIGRRRYANGSVQHFVHHSKNPVQTFQDNR